jgi:transmembrane protein TMEM174 (potassium channel)
VEAAAARGRRSSGGGIGRILALSDGVFAIALTLLILEIAVSATTSNAGLPKALLVVCVQIIHSGSPPDVQLRHGHSVHSGSSRTWSSVRAITLRDREEWRWWALAWAG